MSVKLISERHVFMKVEEPTSSWKFLLLPHLEGLYVSSPVDSAGRYILGRGICTERKPESRPLEHIDSSAFSVSSGLAHSTPRLRNHDLHRRHRGDLFVCSVGLKPYSCIVSANECKARRIPRCKLVAVSIDSSG